MRRLLPFLALVPALLASSSCQQTEAVDDGWLVLWDGGSLGDWRMAGPGEFHVEDGALRADGGMGLLWYAGRSFADFTLRLEWSVEEESDNSGVFVRFPDPGDDPWVAVNAGYEIQICDTGGEMHDTGSVYSFQPSTSIPTNPAGMWNEYEITVRGQHYEVRVNGELVCEFEGERSAQGFVGLQNHDPESPVRFRNIRALPL